MKRLVLIVSTAVLVVLLPSVVAAQAWPEYMWTSPFCGNQRVLAVVDHLVPAQTGGSGYEMYCEAFGTPCTHCTPPAISTPAATAVVPYHGGALFDACPWEERGYNCVEPNYQADSRWTVYGAPKIAGSEGQMGAGIVVHAPADGIISHYIEGRRPWELPVSDGHFDYCLDLRNGLAPRVYGVAMKFNDGSTEAIFANNERLTQVWPTITALYVIPGQEVTAGQPLFAASRHVGLALLGNTRGWPQEFSRLTIDPYGWNTAFLPNENLPAAATSDPHYQACGIESPRRLRPGGQNTRPCPAQQLCASSTVVIDDSDPDFSFIAGGDLTYANAEGSGWGKDLSWGFAHEFQSIDERYRTNPSIVGSWTCSDCQPGVRYHVQAHFVTTHDNAMTQNGEVDTYPDVYAPQHYRIYDMPADGSGQATQHLATTTVQPLLAGDAWMPLGTFTFDGTPRIEMSNVVGIGFDTPYADWFCRGFVLAQWDAVRFVPECTTAEVAETVAAPTVAPTNTPVPNTYGGG